MANPKASERERKKSFYEGVAEIVPLNAKATGTDYEQIEADEDRGGWDSKLDYILSTIGYTIGLGNIWRFPFLAYENGGGSFLIPYLLMLIFAGMPMYFLELALGQYHGQGPARIYGRMAPIFKGLGFGMIMITFVVTTYYNIIMAYAVFYMFAGMQSVLPWSVCGEGSSERCYNLTESQAPDVSSLANDSRPAPEDFFYHQMMGMDLSEHNWSNFGSMQWPLVLSLLVSWIMVCGALIKGVKSSGKVVYFTAIFPIVMLLILFVVGCTLEGFEDGIYYYLKPDSTKLMDYKVWQTAANQILISLSPGLGGIVTLSSYNKFNNNCHRDAILVTFCNCLTSFFAGFVVFAILGFMANQHGVPVDQVVKGGPGLFFIAFPEALAKLEFMGSGVPPVMSFMFFIMVLTLGLDSMFTMIETVTTAITDQFRALRARKGYVVIAICIAGFLCGLSMCMSYGYFLLDLLDRKILNSWNFLLVVFLEVLLVGWVYGADRFLDNIKEMDMKLGTYSYWFWKLCWQYATPAILFILGSLKFVDEMRKFGEYDEHTSPSGWGPLWVEAPATMMLSGGSVLLMVLVSAWNVFNRYRNGKDLGMALLKTTDKWRPKTSTAPASLQSLDQSL